MNNTMRLAEIAVPSPKSTINSYRSFGYNLSTAIADIIDNSISANARNIHINYQWKGQESFISISDDGIGMDARELVSAMTLGFKNPDDARSEDDLGRFGMGLKTASFSQCKSLSVISKKAGYTVVKRCWDIDYINENNEWQLLDYVSDSSFLTKLENQASGTIVLWGKIDRIIGDATESDTKVKRAFYAELTAVQEHLSLVFHRYIEKNKITIHFQGEPIKPTNPFLLNSSKMPEMGKTEYFDNVDITYYILPHMSALSREEYNKAEDPIKWFERQGFYIYRNERLLVYGDWLGLEKKKDYSKLARIAVNFTNSTDFFWNLDIKKSTATPPLALRGDLKRIAQIAIKKSAKIYNYRGSKALGVTSKEIKVEPLWKSEDSRNGLIMYKINRKHPIIKELLSNENNNLAKLVISLLEQNIPIHEILRNQNDDPSIHEFGKVSETPPDELINLAKHMQNIYLSQGKTKEYVKEIIMGSVPFNNYPLIEQYLNN